MSPRTGPNWLDFRKLPDPRMNRILMKFPLDLICVISGFLIVTYKLESSGISDFRMNRFLLRSRLELPLVLALYFTAIHIGPTFMKHREPFRLRTTIIVYNIVQIVANAAIFLLILPERSNASVLCTEAHTSNSDTDLNAQKMHHYYALLKYFDLVETVFYVLRKKERQISFLHVYHHVGVLVCTVVSGMYFPGGQGLFVALYNTIIHCIMYCYYLMSSLSPDYKGHLWWKKYVTVLQIIQHCLIFLSVAPAAVNPNCSYPKYLTVIFSLNVLSTIYLFVQFYVNTYLTKAK